MGAARIGPLADNPVLRARIVEAYQSGKTVRETAALTGSNYTTTLRVLHADAPDSIRKPGGRR